MTRIRTRPRPKKVTPSSSCVATRVELIREYVFGLVAGSGCAVKMRGSGGVVSYGEPAMRLYLSTLIHGNT
eukprot:scaffold55435_cov73-Cyclotella_meneghiniana.AAC.4